MPTPSSWRATVAVEAGGLEGDDASPSAQREHASFEQVPRLSGEQVEVPEPDAAASEGSQEGDFFWSSEDSAVEETDDKEVQQYRNLDKLTPKSLELPKMNEDDDPLSTALQYIRMQRELLKSGDPAVVEEESKMKAWVDMEELELLLQEELEQRLVRKWVYFDLLFGFIILANGVMLGLSTQGVVDEDSGAATAIELIFVCIFIVEWCYRWRYKSTGLRGMLRDKWTLFDFFVICVTVFDIVILGALQIESGASMLTALRVIRLFRLVRLVRLFRLLKKLWMIVSGMSESLRILFWSIIMMSLFCYVFGLFALELARSSVTLEEDPEKTRYWGSVTASVLSMAEIATHNGERPLTLLGEISLWNVPLSVVFLFSASLGLLNLVIAVQMTSSLHLAKKDDLYDSIIDRLIQHRSLRRLREMLCAHCLAHGGSTSIHREQLVDLSNTPADEEDETLDVEPSTSEAVASRAMSPSPKASASQGTSRSSDKSHFFKHSLVRKKSRDVSKISVSATVTQFGEYIRGDKSTKRPSGFQLDFESAGVSQLDINLVFDEIDAINGFAKPMSVDEFIECCMMLKNPTKPIDLVSWTRSICAVYNRLVLLNSATTDTARALDEASEQVRALLKKYHTAKANKDSLDEEDLLSHGGEHDEALASPGRDAQVDHDEEEEEKRRRIIRDEQEANLTSQENTHILQRNNWTRFDFAFSLVVLLNTVMLGVEAATDPTNVRDVRSDAFDTVSMAWFIVEGTFLVVYLIEFVFRTIFHFQMEIQGDYRRVHLFLPKLVLVMDRQIACQVFYSIPRWLKNLKNFMLLDLALIVTGFLDNVVLRIAYTDADDSKSYSRALKLVGLLRLLRGLRLLRLVRPLRSLIRAFLINTKIIFWSFTILVAVVYAGAIAMVQLVGREDRTEAALQKTQQKWSNLGSAMSILSEMVTFANWEQHLSEIAPFGIVIWFGLAVFLVISSLGVLNFVTGVMVQVAFSQVLNLNTLQEESKLADGKVWIQEAISRAFAADVKRREADKAKLQSRVAEMRQEVFRVELKKQVEHEEANANSGSSMLSPQARLRRSRQQSVTSEDIVGRATVGALFGDHLDDAPRASGHQATASMPQSTLTERTYCTVSGVFWMAEGDLCISITAVDDLRHSSAGHDPMRAALMWDNGRCSPLFYIPDHAAMEEVAKHNRRTEDGGARDSAASSGRHHRGKTGYSIGNLFFGKVPVGQDLFFQFGPNHTKTRVYPIKSSVEFDEKIPFIDVVPIDTDVLTVRELRVLMQDPVFNKRLAKINLGAEQVYMSYATINVNCTGKVKVADFIEGLMRLRRQDLGLDTAAAKSLFRRTILEAGELSKEALMVHMCFSSMVQKLHGVNLIEQGETEDVMVFDEEDEAAEDRQVRLAAENQSFRRKLSRLKEFVERKKADVGGPCNLSGFGRIADDEDILSSHHSITSASPGWD